MQGDARSVAYSAEIDVQGVVTPCTGVVRPLRSGLDIINAGVFHARLKAGLIRKGGQWEELATWMIVQTFAGLCLCAQDCTGFMFPVSAGDEDALAERFVAWLEADRSLYLATSEAYRQANAPTNALALQPPQNIPPEKKRVCRSQTRLPAQLGHKDAGIHLPGSCHAERIAKGTG